MCPTGLRLDPPGVIGDLSTRPTKPMPPKTGDMEFFENWEILRQ